VICTLTRRYRFSASHRLNSELLTEAENQSTFGKCNNPYGHGHDYVLDVSVTGEPNPATGLIVRLSLLDKLVQDEILTSFSYRNLNRDVPEFQRLVPTTENVALVIAARLRARWAPYFTYSSAHLSSISIHETDRNSFEVLLPHPAAFPQVASVEQNESVIVNA
jgi:6-pyruvoyltetrahydropterin/6-carboxytetrahydropterin synthase